MSRHSNWIPLAAAEGVCSRQAHADLPEGTFEREIGKEGFFGPATHMYHAHPPTGWVDWDGPLRPRAYNLNRTRSTQPSPFDARRVLENAHCKIRFWHAPDKMTQLARNGDGDELVFCHAGEGDFFCDYGHMAYRAGDYILVPRSTMWRIEAKKPSAFLLIEATGGSYQLPEKGILGQHAIFDPMAMDTPKINDAFRAQQSDSAKWVVAIKRRDKLSRVTYPFNPLDAVGWRGGLSVLRINVADIRPLMSHRYHLPPSAHTTFVSSRFVVCTFCPRPFETDPGALKVPFFHNNDDFDEVLFYHAGDFFSRDNIEAGMMTWHPCGFTHGPHPKALKRMFQPAKEATDEYAVMIDTRDGLEAAEGIDKAEWTGYVDSWKAPGLEA